MGDVWYIGDDARRCFLSPASQVGAIRAIWTCLRLLCLHLGLMLTLAAAPIAALAAAPIAALAAAPIAALAAASREWDGAYRAEIADTLTARTCAKSCAKSTALGCDSRGVLAARIPGKLLLLLLSLLSLSLLLGGRRKRGRGIR